MFFTTTTQLAFASVASVALAKQALPRVTGAVRRYWSNYSLRPNQDDSDASLVYTPSAFAAEAANATNILHKNSLRASDGLSIHHSNSSHAQLAPGVPLTNLTLNKFNTRNVDPIPKVPVCQWAAIGARFRAAKQASTNTQTIINTKAQSAAIHEPKSSNVSAKKSGWTIDPAQAPSQASSNASTSTAAANSIPKVPGPTTNYIVPFPEVASHSLRASQSAPARMSRMTKPSHARRVIPAKRPVKTQHTEVDSTLLKRQRSFHPYESPIKIRSTPPRGSLAALSVPSPPPSDSPAHIANSDSVMSLSELAHDRQSKCTRTAPLNTLASETAHEQSNTGKPGAFVGAPSLLPETIRKDVEVEILETRETPEVAMSSLGLEEDLDEWMWPTHPTRSSDEDMRSPFDDDVDMTERLIDEDEYMMKLHLNEDIKMRDWTDEDVDMAGIT